MRKMLSTIFGLICVLVFIVHSFYASGLMFGFFTLTPILLILGRILISCFMIHVILSLPFVIVKLLKGGRLYIRLNRTSLIQYAAGLLLLVFAFSHIFYLVHQPEPWSCALIILTMAMAGIHLFIAVPKSFITLGWLREDTDLKKAKIVAVFAGILPTILSIAAFLTYYPNYFRG